jgi:hypothetical protein
MTHVYVVLCDIAGVSFPLAVCPSYMEAAAVCDAARQSAIRDGINFAPGALPQANFRVEAAPFADINEQADLVRLMEHGRRGIKLEGKV